MTVTQAALSHMAMVLIAAFLGYIAVHDVMEGYYHDDARCIGHGAAEGVLCIVATYISMRCARVFFR